MRREGIARVTHIYKDMRRSRIHCWLEMIKSHHVSENSTTAGQLNLAGLSQYLCDDLSVGLIAVDQTSVGRGTDISGTTVNREDKCISERDVWQEWQRMM